MIKIIIILILVGYVFHKIASFVFRGMFKGFTSRESFGDQQYSNTSRRTRNNDLNIDNIPNKRSKKGDRFSGGEYVDYEEVK
ncbi:DUF4834 family protein [Ekhidna sp. To15]|uniref:DUF4834 family protein n=1 Tax=Ekhidna sp. To15 TaxID=3395267 RepID=UPI003F52037E